MRSHCRIALALTFVLGGAACQATPTEPNQVPLPPTLLQLVDWNFGTSVTTARVQALWLVFEGPPVDVTSRAVWESSAPDVLEIDGPGRMVTVAPGEAEVRVTYQDAVTTHFFRVFAGEPPWPAFKAGEAVEFHGTVRDASSTGLAGVRVEVLGGHNAGKTATTATGGGYVLRPPLVCGPITVRASKAGYHDVTASSIMCEEGMPTVVMTPE